MPVCKLTYRKVLKAAIRFFDKGKLVLQSPETTIEFRYLYPDKSRCAVGAAMPLTLLKHLVKLRSNGRGINGLTENPPKPWEIRVEEPDLSLIASLQHIQDELIGDKYFLAKKPRSYAKKLREFREFLGKELAKIEAKR